MSKGVFFTDLDERMQYGAEDDAPDAALVREELRRILASRAFQASRRGKEFLEYVVEQKLNGHGDELKERLIGITLFGRKADYSTGEDPVVRVQAGDVRHRLERHYADPESHGSIAIHIPLGSYAPVFRILRPASVDIADKAEQTPAVVAEAAVPVETASSPLAQEHGVISPGLSVPAATIPVATPGQIETRRTDAHAKVWTGGRPRGLLAAFAVLLLVGFAIAVYLHHPATPVSKEFWQPATTSSKPVLLCLPKPMVYRPSDQLFARYEQAHPNTPATRESRQDKYLPLSPSEPILWSDMVPSYNAGPGIGGVIAAIDMSRLLTEQGIRFEVRFGDEASYADMRDSPAVIIGAMNTDWASQLTSGSHFVFDETVAAPSIYEVSHPKRVWKMEVNNGHTTRDYGLITRQLSGKAGQFLVQVAGISHYGTEAASELLLESNELTNVLRADHIDLKKTDLQIVVSTDITNGRAGPPHIVAVSTW